ncbi:MAG: helix-turn-helix domain-containing protein [Acidobacteriales bacterium]|nr:helix-turn-helix domain-containing protein [Terriglobales bacterium]
MGGDDIKYRDHRTTTWFWLDNEVIDHYARLIGTDALAVYSALCRHSMGRAEVAVTHAQLARKIGLARSTVFKAMPVLVKAGLIEVKRPTGSLPEQRAKQLPNTYVLLDVNPHVRGTDMPLSAPATSPCPPHGHDHVRGTDTSTNTKNTKNKKADAPPLENTKANRLSQSERDSWDLRRLRTAMDELAPQPGVYIPNPEAEIVDRIRAAAYRGRVSLQRAIEVLRPFYTSERDRKVLEELGAQKPLFSEGQTA